MTTIQERRGDIVTSRETGREIAVLYDGQDHWVIDPWLNAGREVLLVAEAPWDDLRDLPTVAEARLIDAMPALSFPPRA